MPLTAIDSPPELDSFTTLADHQSQTPTTFYGAKPVLHFHSVNSIAVIPLDQANCLPLWPAAPDQPVDIYVSSEYVLQNLTHTMTALSSRMLIVI